MMSFNMFFSHPSLNMKTSTGYDSLYPSDYRIFKAGVARAVKNLSEIRILNEFRVWLFYEQVDLVV